MKVRTLISKSIENLYKQTNLINKNSNKIFAISKNTQPFRPFVDSLSGSNSVGCLTDPFKSQSIDDVYSIAYIELPSTWIPFHAYISGRNAPTVGRWIRKHVMEDDELGELPDFSKFNNPDGLWSNRRLKNMQLPSQIQNLDPLSINSLIYFTERSSEDFVSSVHQKFPQATKLGLQLPPTPFETGLEQTLIFPNHEVVKNGLIGVANIDRQPSNNPNIDFKGYAPLSSTMELTNVSGNIILTLDGKNACRTLLELLNKSRIDKDDDYYISTLSSSNEPLSIHKISSGDPSRGAIALDTVEDLTQSSRIQFLSRPSPNLNVDVNEEKSPLFTFTSSKYPLLSSQLTNALNLNDTLMLDNHFIVNSEYGFSTSVNKQLPWTCNVEAIAKFKL